MTSNRIIILALLAVAAGVAVSGAPVFAHHSATMFDTTKVIEITGKVKELQWTNPHIWIQIEVQSASGTRQEWSIEGGGPNTLSRQGWRPTTFTPGDSVTLRVNPMRDGTPAGLFVGAKFSDGKTLGRWE
jgi:Family of unknown function (DUF6152)